MKKILIIEDEKDTRKVLSTALKLDDEGYEVVCAENGQSGLKTAREFRPDLILLDIMMPDISGIEVCRSLKSDEEYKSIQIIMLTALDKTDNIVKGLAAGAEDYVSKPFNMPELLARVRSHLKMKGLYDVVKSEKEEKSAILDVSKSLSGTLDPHQTLFIICKKIAEVIEVKRCSIIYVDTLRREAYVMASHDSKEIRHLNIDIEKYPEIETVIKTGKPVVINDVYNDPILFSVRDVLNLIDIKSILAFPISFKDTLIGTMILRTSRREEAFNDREIRFCDVISHLAAAPLKNAYLFDVLHKEKEQERKKRIAAEDLSRTSRELFEITIEASPVPVCVLDKEGNITDVNGSYLKEWASGLKRESVIGTNILKNTKDNSYLGFYKKILNGEKIKEECDSEPSAKGEVKTHIFNGAPVLDAEKKIIGGLFITDEITHHRQLEDSLKEKTKNLEKFHKVTVGRELDMIKLKKEINSLLEELGRGKKY
jgi:PAS domain S-box-containing protein